MVSYYWRLSRPAVPRRVGTFKRRQQRSAEIAAARRPSRVSERLRRVRLEARPRTAKLRENIRTQAWLWRSPVRWISVGLIGLFLLAGAVFVPLDEGWPLRVLLIPLLVCAWWAGFAVRPWLRGLLSATLLLAAVGIHLQIGEPVIATGVALPALMLLQIALFRR